MSLLIFRSVLLGLGMGWIYSSVFMSHQLQAFNASQTGNKPYFMRSIMRYGFLLITLFLIMYFNIFNIWWVIGGFSLMFWIGVIRRLRVGL